MDSRNRDSKVSESVAKVETLINCSKGTEQPKLEDLNNNVVPWFAPLWQQLGAELQIDDHLLKIIDHDNPKDCEASCSKMLNDWLDLNPAASWKVLHTALNNISCYGDTDIQKAIDLLQQRYTQNRYISPVDDWPLYCPKHYTPLTIIRSSDSEEITVWQKLDYAKTYGSTINNVQDLFPPSDSETHLPYRILIEGAPGVGKTILTKEIAFQWANGTVLHNTKLLLLLFMRNPQVKNITGISSLVNYFFEANPLTSKITNWLVENDGHNLTIVIDGYDEISDGNKSIFISDIINRTKLTNCGLVITSRPAASLHLHNIVDCVVEVLGFTERDQQDFIQNALHGQDDKIIELEEYLQSIPPINTLCYIPLNMSILLCLSRDGISALPKSQTKLHKKFVFMTILHFLKKDNKVNNATIASFKDLPEPYYQAFKELSQLAFLALQKEQSVFTLAEIKMTCPTTKPNDWCDLGLLNSTKYFKPHDGCDYELFHFLHFAFQEYMAAYHIASLPHKEQLKLLINNDIFWDIRYYNTWIMYVGISGGGFAFKHFLSGNILQVFSRFTGFFSALSISGNILEDKIKCLYLLHCLRDNNHEMLPFVEDVFWEGIIDLSHERLSCNDVRKLAYLLLRSPKRKWEKIDLSYCNIDDQCCDVFWEMFHFQSIEVKTLDISYNNLHWESLCKLCTVLKSWQTETLVMSIDMLYDSVMAKVINNYTNKLRSSIKTATSDTKLLITYVEEQNKMIVVYANECDIRCKQIKDCSFYDTVDVLKGFENISEVTHIDVSFYINNDSANERLSVLPPGIELEFRGSDLHSKGAYLLDRASTVEHHRTPFHTAADFLAAVIRNDTLSDLPYLDNLPPNFAKHVRELLQTFTSLVTISIKNANISAKAADDIAAVLSNSNKLQEVYLGGNNLQATGTISIAKALHCTKSLVILALENNNISYEACDDLVAVLSQNINLKKLYLSGNCFQAAGIIKITTAFRNAPVIFGIRNKIQN